MQRSIAKLSWVHTTPILYSLMHRAKSEELFYFLLKVALEHIGKTPADSQLKANTHVRFVLRIPNPQVNPGSRHT